MSIHYCFCVRSVLRVADSQRRRGVVLSAAWTRTPRHGHESRPGRERVARLRGVWARVIDFEQ
jgi:hypothetical protein